MNQLQKNFALLGGLTVLAGGIGLYAWYGVKEPEEKEAERKETSQRLVSTKKLPDGGLAPLAFTSITIKAKGETSTLERVEDDWQLKAPFKARVDKVAIDQITSQLQTGKFKEIIEEKPTDADLQKYGLKEPRFTVTAYENSSPITLYGGIENTFDGSIYMRREGDPAVYSAEGGIRWALEKSPFELRDKELLSFDEGKVKQIDVKMKGQAYALEQEPSKAWRMVRPGSFAADSSTITSMVGSLKRERATAFPNYTPAIQKQFEKPEIDATFALETGEKIRLRLISAGGDAGANALALREEGAEISLIEIPSSALTHLDKKPAEFQDKTVLTYSRDSVSKVSFVQNGQPEIVVEKVATDGGDEKWNVLSPSTGPAKTWKISSTLWSLNSLKATELGEENPKALGRYGLDKPTRSVSLIGNDGKVIARLQVGKEVPGKAGTVYVLGSRNQVLELENSKISELPSTLSDVLDSPPTDAGTELAKPN